MKTKKKSAPVKLACPSCGIAWADHLGVTGTCDRLRKARAALRAVLIIGTGTTAKARLKHIVSLVDQALELTE